MPLKAQAEQLAKMPETLESSGFSRPQSNAVIESVALALEAFAVTPEILDARIDGLRDEMNARFAAQNEAIENLSKSVDRLDARMSAIEESILEFQRSMMRYMVAFLVLMLGAVVGMFSAIVSQLFVS